MGNFPSTVTYLVGLRGWWTGQPRNFYEHRTVQINAKLTCSRWRYKIKKIQLVQDARTSIFKTSHKRRWQIYHTALVFVASLFVGDLLLCEFLYVGLYATVNFLFYGSFHGSKSSWRLGLDHRPVYVGLVVKKSGIETGGFLRVLRVSSTVNRYLFIYHNRHIIWIVYNVVK